MWAAAAFLLMPPLGWLPQAVAGVTGLALGLALVVGEHRARALSRPAADVAASSNAPR